MVSEYESSPYSKNENYLEITPTTSERVTYLHREYAPDRDYESRVREFVHTSFPGQVSRTEIYLPASQQVTIHQNFLDPIGKHYGRYTKIDISEIDSTGENQTIETLNLAGRGHKAYIPYDVSIGDRQLERGIWDSGNFHIGLANTLVGGAISKETGFRYESYSHIAGAILMIAQRQPMGDHWFKD